MPLRSFSTEKIYNVLFVSKMWIFNYELFFADYELL